MADGTYKPVRNVRKGDLVKAGKEGKVSKVQAVVEFQEHSIRKVVELSPVSTCDLPTSQGRLGLELGCALLCCCAFTYKAYHF